MTNTFQHITKIDGRSRFVFRYGMHLLGSNKLPHFSITGEQYEGRRSEPESVGCLHEDFARLCPELAYLVRWHLVDQDGTPMHYQANAVYFWEYLAGRSKWQNNRAPHSGCHCDPLQGLANLICWGALPGEQGVELLDGHLGQLLEHAKDEVEAFKQWLADRLPLLQAAFLADMERAGVKLIPMEVAS